VVAVGAIALGLGLLALGIADTMVPAREGILGYSRVLAPYLALLFIPLGLLALWLEGRARWSLGAIVIAGLALTVVRFAPMLPIGREEVDPSAPRLTFATWNVSVDTVDPDVLQEVLAERDPAVIGLQELGPELAGAIEEDPDIVGLAGARARRSDRPDLAQSDVRPDPPAVPDPQRPVAATRAARVALVGRPPPRQSDSDIPFRPRA
jgi:hypothetical protein